MEEAEVGEVGVDKLGEEVRERVKEEMRASWERWLALSTAIFAVLAAIASLRSGQFANESLLHINEATLKQAQASDAWAYYQAKGIKQTTREAEADILSAGTTPTEALARSREEGERLKAEQQELQQRARELEQERQELQERSRADLEHHHSFAYAVTLLQVAIGLSAVAALVRRRAIWLFALLVGAGGVVFFVIGFAR